MIEATINDRAISVVLKPVDQLQADVMKAAGIGLARGLQFAVGVAQREFLSGPRPDKLDVRTTRLRQSMTCAVETTSDGIRGMIGSNVLYAAFHEFGFSGVQNVSSFTRVIGQVSKGGLEVDTRSKRKYSESRKRGAERQKSGYTLVEFVQAHTRKINYKGRPFARPALEKSMPRILSEIKDEIGHLFPPA